MISYINSFNTKRNNPYISFGAKPMPLSEAKKIEHELLSPKIKVLDVYCHASPDEDTVNAMKVIVNWLKKHKKKIQVQLNLEDTKNLYIKPKKYQQNTNYKKPDISVVVDFNAKERLTGNFAQKLEQNSDKKILGFDHHLLSSNEIAGNLYIDNTAKSCSGIIYRFFESIGKKLNNKDLKSLYCGMLSDYDKFKLIEIKNTELIKLPSLNEDENSKEILEKIEAKLTEKDKKQIYKHLDILSNLTRQEKTLRKKLFDKTQITPNGKLAYLVIEPENQDWLKMGADTTRTSTIIRDIRTSILDPDSQHLFSLEQREKLKKVKGAIVFYRSSSSPTSDYQMSLTTKGDYAQQLVDYIKKNINPNLEAGGHPHRRGGRIHSLDKTEVKNFVNSFIEAADKID